MGKTASAGLEEESLKDRHWVIARGPSVAHAEPLGLELWESVNGDEWLGEMVNDGLIRLMMDDDC